MKAESSTAIATVCNAVSMVSRIIGNRRSSTLHFAAIVAAGKQMPDYSKNISI
ncbi:MAG: hypothetical protein ACJAYF_002980 [Arenicella sp.]|jgi:hypothetical protein